MLMLLLLCVCDLNVGMFRLHGSYPKNQRRPDIRELNTHIYRYFFSIAAMADYLGVSRQALKKRIPGLPYDEVVSQKVKGPRFEGRRVVRRTIIYYEWRTFYYLACCYNSPRARYVQDLFYPRLIFRNIHIAVADEGIFVVPMYVD